MNTFKWVIFGIYNILKSMLTAPDGESWAPGRIMGMIMFLIGQCLIVRASAVELTLIKSPQDWNTFFEGISIFEAAIAGTSVGLILGVAPTDPFGKWWGKEAKTPSADQPTT